LPLTAVSLLSLPIFLAIISYCYLSLPSLAITPLLSPAGISHHCDLSSSSLITIFSIHRLPPQFLMTTSRRSLYRHLSLPSLITTLRCHLLLPSFIAISYHSHFLSLSLHYSLVFCHLYCHCVSYFCLLLCRVLSAILSSFSTSLGLTAWCSRNPPPKLKTLVQ
jgi:hypothetical protein